MEVSKKDAIRFIKALEHKNERRWEVIHENGMSFGDSKGDYSRYGFNFLGEFWDSWEEASDKRGAVKAIKLLFDISDEELE